MTAFRIRGLPAEQFAALFSMSDTELARRQARRLIAGPSGFPCRISLTDAAAGDTVLLVNYEHHRTDSPFRSSFAIYVRESERTFEAVGVVPEQLRSRLLSLRAYDRSGMLQAADIVDGRDIERLIDTLFADPAVAYIHAHFARPGCYAALIERAEADAAQGVEGNAAQGAEGNAAQGRRQLQRTRP